MNDYDVAVLGAGIGGLTSALLLVRKGVRVAVLESQPRAGGCCSSFTASGFTFDACVDSIGALGPGEPLRRLLQDNLGIWDKVRFYELDPVRRNFFPDFTVDIPVGVSRYEDVLGSLFPAGRAGIRKVLSVMNLIYQASVRSMFEEQGGEDLTGYINMSFHDLLSSYVTDRKLQAVLSSYCTFLGLPADEVALITGANILMHYVSGGAYRIHGGVQQLADTMIDEIRAHGGEVFLSDPVSRIVSRKPEGYTVSTRAGRQVTADHLVSNMALKDSLALMDRAPALGKRIDSIDVSGSFVLVYLGIAGNVLTEKIESSVGYFDSYAFDAMLNRSSGCSFGLSVPSLRDGSMAPPDHSALTLHWPVSSVQEIARPERAMIAGRMIGRLENVLPGIRGRVIYKTIAGPGTIARYTGNTAGAAYGWKQGKGFFRNLILLRDTLEHFHLVGHWAGYGGGVMPAMLSAYKVANKILKEE